MQQHPIPRNITGFQFKLIGDMTIKQFGYLAGGIILGYILFRALPVPGVLRLAAWLLFGGGGAALAFLPIQGRPLDVWIKAYFKSVYSPTQFVWKKQNPPPKILAAPLKLKRVTQKKQASRKQYEEVEQKLNSYLKKTEKKPHETLDKKENRALKQTEMVMQTTRDGAQKSSFLSSRAAEQDVKVESGNRNIEIRSETKKVKRSKNQSVTLQSATGTPLPSHIAHHASQAQPQNKNLGKDLVKPTSSEDVIRKRIRKELEQQYKEELEHLKREKAQIEKKMKGLETPGATYQVKRPVSLNEQDHLRILSQEEVAQAGLPLQMSQPNIIVGTIIDPQEQQLPDVLVTIKNKQGRILRALKTNNLGQFVSLTPLPNGEYILEAEDPNGRLKFDIIRIKLHGKKFPPIAIIGKTKEESKQEEIRKKLFNKQAV